MNYKAINHTSNGNTCTSFFILAACLISIICSIIAQYDALPNKDGLLYISTADIYLNNGLQAALQSYHWPFFSILIACTSSLFKIKTISSGYLLSNFLQALMIYAYFKIFILFKPSRSQLIFALLSIIIFPQLNDYRAYILRDYGFWAFSLLGIYNLINYYKKYNNKYLSFYYINFIMAFLFKAEALIIMLALPLSLLTIQCSSLKIKYTIKNILLCVYSPILILAVLIFTGLFIYLSINPPQQYSVSLLDSLYINLHLNKLAVIKNLYNYNIDILNKYIFYITPLSNCYAVAYFLCGATIFYMLDYISVLNPLNIILLFMFFKLYKNKSLPSLIPAPKKNIFRIIFFSIFITSLLPLLFLYLIFVSSGRYYILSSILFLLLTPFVLDYYWALYWQKIKIKPIYQQHKLLFHSLASIIVLSSLFLSLISTGYSKTHIKQAGLWFKNHTQAYNLASSPHPTFSNNTQLNYYAGLNTPANESLTIDQLFNNQNLNQYKYLLLKIKYKDKLSHNKIKELEDNKTIQILSKFNNKRNDAVYIIHNNQFG